MVTEPTYDTSVPVNYEEAVRREDSAKWKEAMELEMES